MIALDQARAQAPAHWTGEHVCMRLIEALHTERKMPRERFGNGAIKTAWPASPIHEFVDMLHWDNPGDGARERVWDSWARAKGASSIEVSRMDQAYGWLDLLPDAERRCMREWVAAKVSGYPLRKLLRRKGWSRTTFYRVVSKAASRIAAHLNAQGVQLR